MTSSTTAQGSLPPHEAEPQVFPDDISPERKQAQRDYSAVLKSLPLDPRGVFFLGKDGVLRSLAASGEVLDAVPLSPALIKADLDRDVYDQQTEQDFLGVDGRKAPREHWFHPPPEILPPGKLPLRLDAEQLREEMKLMKEMGLSLDIQPGGKGTERGDAPMCPVHVTSNYNIFERSEPGTDMRTRKLASDAA